MQWTTELADDWDDVAADPPAVDGAVLEMNWVDEGFVLARETGDEEPLPKAEAVFSTVACKVGNDTADRPRMGEGVSAQSAEP
jgi:hypothetical protein